MAGITTLLANPEDNKLPKHLRCSNWRSITDIKIGKILEWIWSGDAAEYRKQLINYVRQAKKRLIRLLV